MIAAAGLIERITPFIVATYGLPLPKSVVRVMTGQRGSQVSFMAEFLFKVFYCSALTAQSSLLPRLTTTVASR